MHPAKFSSPIVTHFASVVGAESERLGPLADLHVLDPFGGVGGIHALAGGDVFTWAVEIEPEFAAEAVKRYPSSTTICADSIEWALGAGSDFRFDVLATSPVYPNGMADCYTIGAQDGSKRNTYTAALGRKASPLSAGSMGRWQTAGGARHRDFHERAYAAYAPLMLDGGLVLINISDHYYSPGKGIAPVLAPVTDFHRRCWEDLGWTLVHEERIATRRNLQSPNRMRADYESVLHFRK